MQQAEDRIHRIGQDSSQVDHCNTINRNCSRSVLAL